MIKKIIIRLFLRDEPFSLFNFYFFYFGNDKYKKFHRRLVLNKLLRLVYPTHLLFSIANGLNWYFYKFWKQLYLCIKYKSLDIKQESNIPVSRQILDIIILNLLYKIKPFNYYRYKLHIKENSRHIHKYIFSYNVPYCHNVINSGIVKSDCKLIGDKHKFSAELKLIDIPNIETISIAEKKSGINTFFRKNDLFCKPVLGSGNRNAFKLKYKSKENRYEIYPMMGKNIAEYDAVISYLKEVIRSDKMLIQRCLKDHSCLISINNSEEITILRVVSGMFKNGEIKPIYMQLEVPMETKHEKTFKQFFKIYPIDLDTLDVSLVWQKKTKVKYQKDIRISLALKQLISDSIEFSLIAHKSLLNLKSVAFDLALTPNGPIMIEANYNWNIELLYNVINTEPLTYDENISASMWIKEIFRM